MNAKKTYIGIAVIVLIFGLLVIPKIIERLSNDEVVVNDRLNVAQKQTVDSDQGDLAYIKINGKDRRVPSFKFVNQNKDTITDKDYRGKVFLVEFFFTRCPDICIPMNKNLVAIQQEFQGNDKFGIASITIDPENDSPEVLKEYAEHYGVDESNWNFLTGSRDSIYTLANEKFGLLAQENPNIEGGLLHSGYFALVDQNGFIRSRLDPFGNPKVYYKGSIPRDKPVVEDGDNAEIDILVDDIKLLLKKNTSYE